MPSETNPATYAVTGAGGSIGRRVVEELRRRAGTDAVVAVDPASSDLKRALQGVEVVVHCAFAVGPESDDAANATRNTDAMARVLDAAGSVGAQHVVLLSSATVYGAWPNNPVPLTEDAPVRPNPGFGFAVQKAELERMAGEWADDHPGATLAVLRPAVPLGEEQTGFLASVLGVDAPVATGEGEVPVQFVHLDDLASAVVHAATARLDGVFNVAADGWLTASEARAIAGTPPRVRVPDRVHRVLERLGRRPSGAQPYTVHPWVVATDRIKATGWSPAKTNEVAIVDTTDGMPWSRLSPKRKQEVALAATGFGVVLAGLATAALVRWLRRRARSPKRTRSL